MNISVKSEKPQDAQLLVTVTVASADVDAAIKNTYREISQRYNFQGFRRGHVPPQVINGLIGKEAVLADSTNTVVEEALPLAYDELDIVPLGDPDFGDQETMVEQGKDFTFTATLAVAPEIGLKSYDAPAIEMPPAEPTEAEIDAQIKTLMGYHTTYEDIKSKRMVRKNDIVSIDVENVENAAEFAGEGRMLDMGGAGMPPEFDKQIVGMHAGDEREITWKDEGDAADAISHTVKVKLNSIKEAVTPELTDDFAKQRFGFGTVAELREAVADEIKSDKEVSLPNIKEERVCEAVAAELDTDEVPDTYIDATFSEIVQNFLNQLSSRGLTLDTYLQQMGITTEQFVSDTRVNAAERARQSLALDALAEHLKLKATDADVRKEFADAQVDDVDAAIENFREAGRLPAVREGIRRAKALDWLVEHAKVTEVDEAARAAAAEDKPAEKKTEKKSAAKKDTAEKKSSTAKKAAAGSAAKKSSTKAAADENKPAAKKTSTKSTAKKAAAASGEKKPAAKKTAAKKSSATSQASAAKKASTSTKKASSSSTKKSSAGKSTSKSASK